MDWEPREEDHEVEQPIKLRCECSNEDCDNYWTSNHGTSYWYYCISNGIMYFTVKIYQQECRDCGAMGAFDPYESDEKRMYKIFINHVFKNYFPERRLPYPGVKGQKGGNHGKKKHVASLCQACKKGVCFYKRRKG